MGYASTYFFDSNNADKQTLHRRIRPSDRQFIDQQDRWNVLKEYLLPILTESSGYAMDSWLQGSYKFGTQIRPVRLGGEFDIDLGVYYCWAGEPTGGNFGPKELKSFVQEALKAFARENDDVKRVGEPPKARCCRIHFEDAFHIDVPCYHLDSEADERTLATEDDEWEKSDPKALYEWFTSEFAPGIRDKARRHIRYLKAWAALKLDGKTTDPPSSVLLTVLVANAVAQLSRDLPSPEDEAFAEILRVVLEEVDSGQDIRNPVDEFENLASRMSEKSWSYFTQALKSLYVVAKTAIKSNTAIEACTAWTDAFEHLFPLPDEETLGELAKNLPAIRTIPEVKVTAISRDNQRFRKSDTNHIGPIRKNCDISFRVMNADQMPYGTRYVWLVRNEGDEAEDRNDLGHQAGTGLTAGERSAYNGTHYMDCTAYVGNQIIGVRRVKVTINGERAPRRNPKKPAYVSLRGKR